ncbi:hypothetical protein YM18_1508 [Geobacter sulfurreducens]|nr:hypothetical protein YM18_1508 [Geobacter sulfurreducens]
MPISIDNVVIFSVGGILGYLARTLIDHRLAKSRTNEDRTIREFNDAAAKFRNEFTETVTAIRESQFGTRRFETTFFSQLFTQTYPAHHDALVRFKHYLSNKDQEAIEKAWEEHCWNGYLDEKESHDPFLHYHYELEVEMRDGQPHTTKTLKESFDEAKQLATANIEKLLSFAKPK